MATQARRSSPVNPDTPVVIKVTYDGANRRFKLPMKDLGAYTLPSKLRQILDVPTDANLVLERYSDSAATYILLDSENPSVYKQLYRAAKAKLKLRIKASIEQPQLSAPPHLPTPPQESPALPQSDVLPANEKDVDGPKQPASTRASYLDTVLQPPVSDHDKAAYLNDMDNNDAEQNYNFHDGAPDADASYNQQPPAFPHGSPHPWNRSWDAAHWAKDPVMEDFWNYSKRLTSFCIDCNKCGATIADEHFHCSICDEGDYDLCPGCVDAGVLCPGESHWLIKRTLKDGAVVNSTTETIAPKWCPAPEEKSEQHQEDIPEENEEADTMLTCNACFREYEDKDLMTCLNCPDYDLCLSCLIEDVHGHHPGHQFSMVAPNSVESSIKQLMAEYSRPGGRNSHDAICDGCEKRIVGVRNKCFNCPDFDYCADCMQDASMKHPGHRFAPLYDPIPGTCSRPQKHVGVFCDGPLCNQAWQPSYIAGVRYKCTICHDTDFCANCEAHPSNQHNPTHPLIKLKTPVRHVSVSTFGEDDRGSVGNLLGDRRNTKSAATETVAPRNSNAATQVQNRDSSTTLAAEPQVPVDEALTKDVKETKLPSPPELQAYFVKDTILDGTTVEAGDVVTQTWTLFNPGPSVWPVGSSVRYIGGDSMFNVDTDHPTSLGSLTSAMESNQLTEQVGPMESAKFTVTLKMPRRVGRAISYWRLKTPDGEPFGHKLWCDVNVQEPVDTFEPTQVPVANKNEGSEAGQVEVGKEKPATTTTTSGGMIFPKLEKESPESSTHEDFVSAKAAEQHEETDLAEEVESLAIDDDESDDEGFLTDEEYDILDASDQEYAVEAEKAVEK